MKKIEDYIKIDIDEELNNVLNYVFEIYDGDRVEIEYFVKTAYSLGVKESEYRIEKYLYEDTLENIKKYSKENTESVVVKIILNLFKYEEYLNKDLDFEKKTEKLLKDNIGKSNKKIIPKNWNEIKKTGIENIGSFDYVDDKKFKGYDSETASAPGMHIRINLPNTYYAYTEQDKSIIYNLFSSIYAHGLIIKEHNNTVDVNNQLNELLTTDNYNEYLSNNNNKILKCLLVDYVNDENERLKKYHDILSNKVNVSYRKG